MIPAYANRALLLYQQRRYELAVADLRAGLAVDEQHPYSYALLALCLSELKKPKDADAALAEAFRLDPEFWFAHYVRANLFLRRSKYKDSEAAAIEAIRVDPDRADAYDVLGRSRLAMANWKGALEAADQGLLVDADDVGCRNVRGRALMSLGRRQEALTTGDSALTLEPDNAYSHVNKGWMLLEIGDSKTALWHFREALRLDPQMQIARQGAINALKLRNPLYRVLFGYFTWMRKFPRNVQLGIIFGLWAVAQIVNGIEHSESALAPYAHVLLVSYIVFCLITWVGDPLMNALVTFDPFGKLAVTAKQRVVGYLVMSAVAVGVGCLIVYAFRRRDPWLIGGFGYLFTAAVTSVFGRMSNKPLLVVWAMVSIALTALVTFLVFTSGPF